MVTKTLEKVPQQLHQYEIKLQQYEKAYLQKEGAVAPEEQALLVSIRTLIQQIQTNLPTSKGSDGLPPAFKKGIAALTTHLKALQTKIEQLKKAGKLEALKDKLSNKIQKLEANFPKLNNALRNCTERVKQEGQQQLEALATIIHTTKKQLTTEENSTPSATSAFESVGAMLQSYDTLLSSFQNNSYLQQLFSN
ncbi:MAG: hypothetical protein ACRBFS_15680 [Aureispira sp.]